MKNHPIQNSNSKTIYVDRPFPAPNQSCVRKNKNLKALHNLAVLLLASMLLITACASEKPEINIKIGDLVRERGQEFHFVKGNVIDSKNISIKELRGNVRGDRTKRIFVQNMHGDIETGAVTVDILHGNIIDGRQVAVNLLIGTDFSGKAVVARRLDPAEIKK